MTTVTSDKSTSTLRTQLQFSGDKPFRIAFETPEEEAKFNDLQEKSKIRQGMFQYLKRLRELTQTNFPKESFEVLPMHFRSKSRLLVVVCSDGIIVRFDPQAPTLDDEVYVVPLKETMSKFVPSISLGFVYVSLGQSGDAQHENIDVNPPNISIQVAKADGTIMHEPVPPTSVVMTLHVGEKPENISAIEPESIVHHQVRSKLEFGIDGVEVDEPRKPEDGRSFQIRKSFSIPLHWDAISVFPWAMASTWRELNFPRLAEHHFFESAFHLLKNEIIWLRRYSQDRLRKYYKSILDQFDALLEKADTQEEHLQQFLTKFPVIVSPGYKRVIPKQTLGPHVTDFIFEEREGEFLLVELESPVRRLFTNSGHEAADLTHARGQIDDWVRYIQDNKSTVERELSLVGMSASPRTLIIIGRSASLSEKNRRKLQVGRGRAEVMTYDDLRNKFFGTVESFVGLLSHTDKPYDIAYFIEPDPKEI